MKKVYSTHCLDLFDELINLLRTNRRYERVFHYMLDRIVRLYSCRDCAIVCIDHT